MFARVIAFVFVALVLGGPLVGLVSLVGNPYISTTVTQQKSMCLITGIGCGAGHILLPAVGRL